MKKNILLTSLTCLFIILIGATAFISFSGNIDTQKVTVKSITAVYDENSGVLVTQDDVTFNDKNQVVDYKVVIENKENYDVKINNINLTTPTEEFLNFEVKETEGILESNSTKEIVVSFETTGIKGWGRNFNDELTANISFEKVAKQEEVVPPAEETPKEDENTKEEEQPKEEEVPKEEEPSKPNEGEESSKPEPQPEAPVKDEKELIKNFEKLEEVVVTTNTIEIPKEINVSVGEKIAVWIYSEPIFLGYFDVVVENGVKKIEGLEEALAKVDIKAGDHNLVLVSNEETIGYVPVTINENKELVLEDNKIDNPYTSDNKLLIVLITATSLTGLAIVVVSKNKVTKYMLFAIILGTTFVPINAEETIELSKTFNVNFKSQNVMKASGCSSGYSNKNCENFWSHSWKIININIYNETIEMDKYDYKFNVTESQKERVFAYLVKNESKTTCYDMEGNTDKCYDLYLQSDGIMYPNEDASYYFSYMLNLENIYNLSGLDTSNVTNMSYMFNMTGFNSKKLKLDLRSFDTSKVTNMNSMFNSTGYQNKEFELNISGFDTKNVTNMKSMFYWTGYNSSNFTLDVSGFDTSNVTDMSEMFYWTGYNSSNFTLNVSKFDTSKVTNMNSMFYGTGYNSQALTLDVSNFNTSNVTDMGYMFLETGYSDPNFELNISNFDTSKVTNMSYMLLSTGYNSTKLNFSIDITNPNVGSYSSMFFGIATKTGAKVKVNYTNETEELVKQMIATKSDDSNVVLGNLIIDVDNISIGDEIHISGEKFNVISQTEDTVTMFAQLNINNSKTQSEDYTHTAFSDTNGWEFSPGPKEIDIQIWGNKSKTLLNNYVSYLQEQLKDNTITGDLITIEQIKSLGCNVPSDYAYISDGRNCENSTHKSWLITTQYWWTRSASTGASGTYIWVYTSTAKFDTAKYNSNYGIRPTITISKETLRNYK